ncbi:MAG: hypothetical protein R3Y32_06875 [Bacillota bacterium]
MKKARQQFNKRIFAFMIAVVLLFSAVVPTVVYASSYYECDCTACVDGVITTTSTIDCTNTACVNGTVSTTVSSTCTACSGSGYSYSFCPTCGGEGYYVTPIYYKETTVVGYLLYGCTTCGGSGDSSAVSYSDLNFDNITYGCGRAVCSSCTNGTVYTTTTETCTTCSGIGTLTETTFEDCTTCDGSGSFVYGIDNISRISTQIISLGDSKEVSFTFDTVGDVGDIEYYWFVDDVMTKMTIESNYTIDIATVGTYEIYCTIVPAVGYTYQTNTFKVYVTGSIFDSSSTDTDDSSSLSGVNMNYVYIALAVLAVCVIAGVVIIRKRG